MRIHRGLTAIVACWVTAFFSLSTADAQSAGVSNSRSRTYGPAQRVPHVRPHAVRPETARRSTVQFQPGAAGIGVGSSQQGAMRQTAYRHRPYPFGYSAYGYVGGYPYYGIYWYPRYRSEIAIGYGYGFGWPYYGYGSGYDYGYGQWNAPPLSGFAYQVEDPLDAPYWDEEVPFDANRAGEFAEDQRRADADLRGNRPSAIKPSTPESRQRSMQAQQQGDAWFRKLNFSNAYGEYKRAMSHAPDRAEPYFRLAQALIGLGHYSMAVTEIKRGLEIDPTWPLTGEGLGELLGRENEWTRSLLFQKVTDWVRRDIRNPDRLFLLGVLLYFDEDYERSAQLFEAGWQRSRGDSHHSVFLQAIDAAIEDRDFRQIEQRPPSGGSPPVHPGAGVDAPQHLPGRPVPPFGQRDFSEPRFGEGPLGRGERRPDSYLPPIPTPPMPPASPRNSTQPDDSAGPQPGSGSNSESVPENRGDVDESAVESNEKRPSSDELPSQSDGGPLLPPLPAP